MPQASDTQRKQRGGEMGRDWYWRRPDWRDPTDEEMRAASFLVDEWDYGWFTQEPHPPMRNDG